jgi:hypothetical protein
MEGFAVETHMLPDGEPASQAVPAQLTINPAAQGFHIWAASIPPFLLAAVLQAVCQRHLPRLDLPPPGLHGLPEDLERFTPHACSPFA